MWMALSELPTYILAIQYAASFGVEITAFNMVATYFHETVSPSPLTLNITQSHAEFYMATSIL